MAITILWIYIGLLLLGGLLGYFLGKSKISLLFSSLFVIALMLCAFDLLPFTASYWFIGALVFVFIIRVMRTRKFMPSGFMLLITAISLILLLTLDS